MKVGKLMIGRGFRGWGGGVGAEKGCDVRMFRYFNKRREYWENLSYKVHCMGRMMIMKEC